MTVVHMKPHRSHAKFDVRNLEFLGEIRCSSEEREFPILRIRIAIEAYLGPRVSEKLSATFDSHLDDFRHGA